VPLQSEAGHQEVMEYDAEERQIGVMEWGRLENLSRECGR